MDCVKRAKFETFRGITDIHKAVGKLSKPKLGFTLLGHKYSGPYNPLDKNLNMIKTLVKYSRSMINKPVQQTPLQCSMMLSILCAKMR